MSGRVTIRLPARRGERRGHAVGGDLAPGARDGALSPAPERIPRVARVLALAHHWQGLIRSGAVRDQADLARLVGVGRARVSQVMKLLWLAPDIQEAVLDGNVELPGIEGALRMIAEQARWAEQHEAFDSARSPHADRCPSPF